MTDDEWKKICDYINTLTLSEPGTLCEPPGVPMPNALLQTGYLPMGEKLMLIHIDGTYHVKSRFRDCGTFGTLNEAIKCWKDTMKKKC